LLALVVGPAPDRVGNISPEELGLSNGLSADLAAWASSYDATLNRDDPLVSGFVSGDDERLFHEQGQRLAERVAGELGSGTLVRYFRVN
jgi:hypothetical protein